VGQTTETKLNLKSKDPSRRSFLKTVAASAAAVGTSAGIGGVAAPTALDGEDHGQSKSEKKVVAIQIPAVSFSDEGVDKVLDTVQNRAGVNTLLIAVFSYGRGIEGRQVPGHPIPDHGVQRYDRDTFHGGDYAEVHPEYYEGTIFKKFRALDLGSFDVLGEVVPKAKKRGMKSICWFEDLYNPRLLDNFEKAAEVDVYGRTTSRACLNNPYVRNFLSSLVEDWTKSYDVDGIAWCSERQGPLDNAIGADAGGFRGRAELTCFCRYCREKARDRGIDVERAREGFQTLQKWVELVRNGSRPADGFFVTFWRVLSDHPEILAWEKLWTDSQRETYSMMYGEVKSIRRDLQVGWHIWHNNSFSPFYRAEQDYKKFEGIADFLKVVMYNNCAGPRLAQYIRNVHSTLFGDLSPQQVLDFHYKTLGYEGEANLESIPQAGLSARYVSEETRRALEDVQGKIAIYPGIDVDVPTGKGQKKTTAQDVANAVRTALSAGAQGIILSRKYSEMWLDHLAGAGQALRELGLWKA
jgi:hypothetical protein